MLQATLLNRKQSNKVRVCIMGKLVGSIRNLSFLIYVFVSLSMVAQKEKAIWYFGNGAGLDFNNTPPTAIDGFNDNATGGSTMSDASGNFLFYTNGISVWDRNFVQMPNGFDLNGHQQSGALIVPFPGSNSLYYIFTTPHPTRPYEGLNYSIVDISIGTGDVISKNTVLLDTACEKLAAIETCDGSGYWLLTHQYGSNAFYAYLITSAGIEPPVISRVGMVVDSNYQASLGQIKFSSKGDKVVCSNYLLGTQIFDFDATTGLLSNPITIAGGIPEGKERYGACFSPDDSKLYLTSPRFFRRGGLYQYDLLAPDIEASEKFMDTLSAMGELQLGIDGKIYVANIGQHYLGVIHNPNGTALTCDYQVRGVSLGGDTNSVYNAVAWNLPNLVSEGLSDYTGTVKNVYWCSNDTLTELEGGLPEGTHLWNTGETTENIVVNDAGTYYVDVTQNGCSYRDSFLVELVNTTSFVSDSTVCNGVPINIFAGTSVNGYSWNTGDTTDAIVVYNGGLYWVSTENECGQFTDSITIRTKNCEYTLYLPNAFSPNDDGVNDTLVAESNGIFESYTMEIYSRWGELLFSSSSANTGWDGKQDGKPLPIGVYLYRLYYQHVGDEETQQKTGRFLLTR